MSKETDWDAVDDDGVIDFDTIEDILPLKKEAIIKPAPKPPQAVREILPPKKEESEPGMTPKQEKIISDVTKQAQKLSKELETLDFNLEKFIKFEQRFSTFKVKNTIAIGSIALLLGGYIGSSVQSELYTYYVNQEVKHKLSLVASDIELLKKAREQGVNFAIDENRIVIYTSAKNQAVAVSKDSNHQIFEIKIGAKK